MLDSKDSGSIIRTGSSIPLIFIHGMCAVEYQAIHIGQIKQKYITSDWTNNTPSGQYKKQETIQRDINPVWLQTIDDVL